MGPEDLDCCRIVFGEADQLPGLTVDRFHDILVTQTMSYGMELRKDVIFPALAEVLRADGQEIRGIYERNGTRSTTAGRRPSWPGGSGCWTASPTRGASPSTPHWAGRSTSPPWM